jgi:hypothetical protein
MRADAPWQDSKVLRPLRRCVPRIGAQTVTQPDPHF